MILQRKVEEKWVETMKIKKIVKVMNFQTLLRINSAKEKAEAYQNVGTQVTNIIKEIVYNKNIVLDKNALVPDSTKPKLNIYIANDYGFCGNFNASIREQIKKDVDAYKIIVGKKITYKDDKTLIKIDKEDFKEHLTEIEGIINDGLRDGSYSEINLYYNHYYTYTQFGFLELKLFPLEFDGEYYEGYDYVSETDIASLLHGLISFYVSYQVKMAEEISVASENVLRKQITDMALDRIEVIEEEERHQKNKEKLSKTVLKNVENYKRVMEGEDE